MQASNNQSATKSQVKGIDRLYMSVNDKMITGGAVVKKVQSGVSGAGLKTPPTHPVQAPMAPRKKPSEEVAPNPAIVRNLSEQFDEVDAEDRISGSSNESSPRESDHSQNQPNEANEPNEPNEANEEEDGFEEIKTLTKEKPKFGYHSRFTELGEEGKASEQWRIACHNYSLTISEEQAQRCVDAVLHLCFNHQKNPNIAYDIVRANNEYLKGNTTRRQVSINSFPVDTIVCPEDDYYIDKAPPLTRIGVPLEQVLKGFRNPELKKVKSACTRIYEAFIEMTTGLTGGKKPHSVLCLATITLKRATNGQYRTMEDILEDKWWINLMFGTFGLSKDKAKEFFIRNNPGKADFSSYSKTKAPQAKPKSVKILKKNTVTRPGEKLLGERKCQDGGVEYTILREDGKIVKRTKKPKKE